MPKEIRVDLVAGQTARIFSPNKMTGGINKSGTSATIKVSGTYVEPVPPDTTKPVIGSIQVLNITKTGATIKWVPSEKSTGQVAYGLTTGLGSLTTKELAYLPSHTQNLTGLQAGKTYYFEIMAEDEAGNLGVSDTLDFDTLPDVVIGGELVGGGGVTITTNGAVIDGLIFSGTYGTGSAITVKADNVTIRNCNIKLFRQGIEAQKCKNLIIESNTITDCDYAGVLSTTQIGGRISKNTIQRIGAARTDLGTSAQNNAYGIAVSNYSGDAPSSDVLIEANIVEDVPLWHGLDTHNGVRITFKDNIVRRTPRALFITKSTTSPKDCIVTGNQFLEAITKTGGTNKQAVTLNAVNGVTFTNNKSSVTYGKPMIQDYTGGGESSTGIVETGTVYVDESVTPPSNEKIVTLSNSDGVTAFLQAVKDMTVDGIRFVNESYHWDKIYIDVDRTARHLSIQGVPGTTFISNGNTSEGVFFLGLNKVSKWISFENIAFDGILLSQAGVFEIRASENVSLKNIQMTNLKRDIQWSDKAGKTWGLYLSGSGSGGAGNKHFLADNISISPTKYRDVGAIQMDSSSAQCDDIVLRNIKVNRCDYAFYGAVPVNGLVLENWDVNDSANIGGSVIRFTATKINGRYSGIKLSSSGTLSNSSTGVMVNGGGNVGV